MTLRERLVYGDDQNNGFTAQQIVAGNLIGKLAQHKDEAGVLRFEAYDFKGNLLEKVRRVIADSAITGVQPFRVNWDTGMTLDPAEYRTSTTYDALNRARSVTYPHDVDGHAQGANAALQPGRRAGTRRRWTARPTSNASPTTPAASAR